MAKTEEEIIQTAMQSWKKKDSTNEFWFKSMIQGAWRSGYTKAKQEAADVIEELENKLNLWRQDKVPRWIPVTERLPEKPGNYLVYANYAKGNLPFVDVDYYSGKNFATVYTCCGYYRVSHWLPLPQPPKEE